MPEIEKLVVDMIPNKETANKMRFKEEDAQLNKKLFKSPIGTLYLPKDPWINAERIRITVEDISGDKK